MPHGTRAVGRVNATAHLVGRHFPGVEIAHDILSPLLTDPEQLDGSAHFHLAVEAPLLPRPGGIPALAVREAPTLHAEGFGRTAAAGSHGCEVHGLWGCWADRLGTTLRIEVLLAV